MSSAVHRAFIEPEFKKKKNFRFLAVGKIFYFRVFLKNTNLVVRYDKLADEGYSYYYKQKPGPNLYDY